MEELLEGKIGGKSPIGLYAKSVKGFDKMTKRYYIAYGSNLNIEQMKWRCPSAKIIGTSEIKNYQLLFRGSKSGSYLTIEPKVGCKVPVAIWETTEVDEKALDRYEGYPSFYYKAEIELPIKSVRTGKEFNHTAYVYIMHEDRPYGVPSLVYVRTCLDGYRYFGFDKNILIKAVYDSRRNCNERQ